MINASDLLMFLTVTLWIKKYDLGRAEACITFLSAHIYYRINCKENTKFYLLSKNLIAQIIIKPRSGIIIFVVIMLFLFYCIFIYYFYLLFSSCEIWCGGMCLLRYTISLTYPIYCLTVLYINLVRQYSRCFPQACLGHILHMSLRCNSWDNFNLEWVGKGRNNVVRTQ